MQNEKETERRKHLFNRKKLEMHKAKRESLTELLELIFKNRQNHFQKKAYTEKRNEKEREMEYLYENRQKDQYDEKGMCKGVIHRVKKGDTLYEISRRYHVSVARLFYANPYVDLYQLRPEEELCIPTVEPEEKEEIE